MTLQVYLSVMLHGGKLGAAYYNTETTFMYVLSDTADTEQLHLLQRCRY